MPGLSIFKELGAATSVILGKVRLVTALGDEVTDDTADAVKAKLSANSGVDIGDVDVTSIAVGTNRIGTVSGVAKEVQVTKALAAASAYTANDVLCEDATTGVDWTFAAVGRANAAYGVITKAIAQSESENVTPRLTLFLFNTAPTGCVNEDHAANTCPDAADKATYIGSIDFPALESLGTTDSVATATPNNASNLPLYFKCAADADDLIGILVTRDAFTQTATDDMTITLTIEQY